MTMLLPLHAMRIMGGDESPVQHRVYFLCCALCIVDSNQLDIKLAILDSFIRRHRDGLSRVLKVDMTTAVDTLLLVAIGYLCSETYVRKTRLF